MLIQTIQILKDCLHFFLCKGDIQDSSLDGIRVSGTPDESKRDGEYGQEGCQTTARPTERIPQREKLRREVEQLLGAMPMFVPQQEELGTSREPVTSPPRISPQKMEREELPEKEFEDEGEREKRETVQIL